MVPLQAEGLYIWVMYPNTKSIFKLEDNSTSLVVPKKGLYLLNLKMYYQISSSKPTCTGNLFLNTRIQKYHPSYPVWLEVIKGIETMQCMDHWSQSVTLSQVARFERGTKLRVVIDPQNYDYIIRDRSTYFSVTLL